MDKYVPFSIIVAFSKNNRGIGCQNHIPWNIPTDLQHFKKITTRTRSLYKKNAVIMGRKTYESLPDSVRPLSERINIVLSHNNNNNNIYLDTNGVIWASSLQHAFEWIGEHDDIEQVFVIGGETIYKQAINLPNCKKIYATMIEKTSSHFDTFFPYIPDTFEFSHSSETIRENQYEFRFLEYISKE